MPDAGLRAALGLLRLRGMQVVLLLTSVRLWVEIAWVGFLPVHLVESGLETATVSTVVATNAFVATLAAPTVGVWNRWLARETVMVAGLGCAALGLALSPQLTAVPLVYVAPLLVGIGSGVSLPLLMALVSDIAPADRRGLALGLRQAGNNVAALAAPLAVGPMVSLVGVALAFAAAGGIAALALAGAVVLHASRRTAVAD